MSGLELLPDIYFTDFTCMRFDYDKLRELLPTLRKTQTLPKRLIAPIFIMWDTTYACCLRCVHCFNASSRAWLDELNTEEALDICDQIARMKVFTVCLSGGEPFLRKDYFRLAEYLSSRGVTVSTITNGWYVNEERAKEMSKYFKAVQVSIDGSRPEVHDKIRGVPGSFERAIKAIKAIKKSGIGNISVAFVPCKYNLNDFPNMVKLCIKLGVPLLRSQPLVPIGRASQILDEINLSHEDYEYLLSLIDNYNKDPAISEKLRIDWGDPIDHIRMGSILGFAVGCQITATGYVAISPYMPFLFGNLREKSLSEIWGSGLGVGWRNPRLSKVASRINTIDDFRLVEGKTAWVDKHNLITSANNKKP